MTSEAAEARLLRSVVVPELEAEGYDVYLYPRRPALPEFFGDFRPDAIALGAKKNLVVEVLRQTPSAEGKLDKIRNLIKDQSEWELRVFWAESTVTSQVTLGVQTNQTIRESISEIKTLNREGHSRAALLLSWATFEAIGRLLLREEFRAPQSPGRLVQVLAQAGYLTPTEADRMRQLANFRNAFVHGDLGAPVSRLDIEKFAELLEALLHEVSQP